jgi:hypothetical protein
MDDAQQSNGQRSRMQSTIIGKYFFEQMTLCDAV